MSSDLLRKYGLLGLAAFVLIAGNALTAEAQEGRRTQCREPRRAAGLDAHWTTATLTEVLTNHLYEGLYALDEGYRPIPMLAESHADRVTRTA